MKNWDRSMQLSEGEKSEKKMETAKNPSNKIAIFCAATKVAERSCSPAWHTAFDITVLSSIKG